MVQLTLEEKTELRSIIGNQYAVGPFSGMIYNEVAASLRDNPNQDTATVIDAALKIALQTKLRLKEVSK